MNLYSKMAYKFIVIDQNKKITFNVWIVFSDLSKFLSLLNWDWCPIYSHYILFCLFYDWNDIVSTEIFRKGKVKEDACISMKIAVFF